MFSNLIESASHQSELKRKGRFFIVTLISYALIVACAGVISIYAYDAQVVESQDLEFLGFVPAIVPDNPEPAKKNTGPKTQNKDRKASTESERTIAIDRISTSTTIPDGISADKSTVPEIPLGGYKIGTKNIDANFSGPVSDAPPGGDGTSGPIVNIATPPPPVIVKTVSPPQPTIIRKSVILNGEATILPKPPYPHLAKITRTEGQVSVQVTIDETGKIVSARASQGHPMLNPAAVKAAYQARFNPTKLNGIPVKVSGVIVYNFKLQ